MESKPTVEKPADKPVTPPAVAEKPAAENKPVAEKPAEKPAAAGPQAATPVSYAGGTTAVLSFSEPLSYATLDKLQPVVYDEETYKPVVLLYYYPLAVAVLLALAFQFLNGTISLFRRSS